jgi:hypothetical protein
MSNGISFGGRNRALICRRTAGDCCEDCEQGAYYPERRMEGCHHLQLSARSEVFDSPTGLTSLDNG